MGKFLKKNLINILLILIFLVGLFVLLYPNISDYINRRNSSKAVAQYDETVEQMNEEQRQKILGEARDFNYNLMMNSSRFKDMNEEEMEEYLSTLNIDGKGMMCYLKIDRLGINVPVYHTTQESVLQQYVGHVEGTSLPVGGLGTHTALSAHRGLPSAVLFTNLDQVEIGDEFSIFLLGQELRYKVDQIETVLPGDVTLLAIDPNKDYVTLITCTPYGVNTHRLLVRGERIEIAGDKETIEGEEISVAGGSGSVPGSAAERPSMGITREQISIYIAIGMVVLLGLVILGLLLIPIVAPTEEEYLRPWDDTIVEVIDAATLIAELATRENWAVTRVAGEADKLAFLRPWIEEEEDAEVICEERLWDDTMETDDELRDWDDEILEKVDDVWRGDGFDYAKLLAYTLAAESLCEQPDIEIEDLENSEEE